jgi:2-iminoacetate synthase
MNPPMNVQMLATALEEAREYDVERALGHDNLKEQDVVALLSRAALPHLETMAEKAQALTRQRFGRTMQLYAPLYLSNECVNCCGYCGFSHDLRIVRQTLSLERVKSEAEHLHAAGFRHILLVSGEAPRVVDLAYLEGVAAALRPRFDSLSIEVGTFDLSGYRRLVAAGIDGLTLYQETYLTDVYRRVHQRGPKHHYDRRILAMQRAGQAGFRTLGIGALLGLAPWRFEAYYLAMHGRALTREFWRSRVAVSFPRIRQNAGGNAAIHQVTDRDLLQMICVTRLALPDAELVLSTREPAELRDRLMGLGITRMSAGSHTEPGGYGEHNGAGEQFSVEDIRTPSLVAATLLKRGFEPVWKDFDRAFMQSP